MDGMREEIADLVANRRLPEGVEESDVVDEAVEYATSYKCTAAIAVRDVMDEIYEGAADSAAALRTTDWDWGRE